MSKLTPPVVQFLLLVAMARLGTLEDVGRLALASAAGFMCGSLAECGFGTTLSVPKAYFGTELPPVRATRTLRLGTAVAGSVVYCLLWACGLGSHELPFLIVAPLPALLALSAGYAGVMNAESALEREGQVTILEAVLTLVTAGLLLLVASPLVAALLGLVVARAIGTALRARIVRGVPQALEPREHFSLRAQSSFLVVSAVNVISGQVDVLAAGFVAAFATLGVFSPLLRTAYTLCLVAEALSWSLYGRAGSDPSYGSRIVGFVQDWRRAAPMLGLGSACLFMATAPWFIPLLLNRDVGSLLVPVLLFGGVILARFVGVSYELQVIRTGRQRARLPGLVAGTLVLLCSGVVGALTGSLAILAAGRILAEVTVMTAYAAVVRHDSPGRAPAAPGAEEALT